MNHEADRQLIELPDGKEITLCDAVTAFVYGKAGGPPLSRWECELMGIDFDLSGRTEPTEMDWAKAEDLLERLQSAAYAGRIKFRGLKRGEDYLDGHKDIDPLYFSIRRGFDWRFDQICNSDLRESVGEPTISWRRMFEVESTIDWRDVHLDREAFVSLLRDMGVSVPQKTFTTGAPGRPSSKHLVLPMAERKLDAGYRPESLTAFSRELAEELAITEPLAVPMKQKTISNVIRKLWHAHQKPPKK